MEKWINFSPLIEVCNFLSEKYTRRVRMNNGIKCENCKDQRDESILTGNSVEACLLAILLYIHKEKNVAGKNIIVPHFIFVKQISSCLFLFFMVKLVYLHLRYALENMRFWRCQPGTYLFHNNYIFLKIDFAQKLKLKNKE